LIDVVPTNAANRELEVTIGDPEIISFEGGVLRGLSPGTATITFAAQDGSGVTATGTVTVEPMGIIAAIFRDGCRRRRPPPPPLPPTEIYQLIDKYH